MLESEGMAQDPWTLVRSGTLVELEEELAALEAVDGGLGGWVRP
jgi:hypothetical protein